MPIRKRSRGLQPSAGVNGAAYHHGVVPVERDNVLWLAGFRPKSCVPKDPCNDLTDLAGGTMLRGDGNEDVHPVHRATPSVRSAIVGGGVAAAGSTSRSTTIVQRV